MIAARALSPRAPSPRAPSPRAPSLLAPLAATLLIGLCAATACGPRDPPAEADRPLDPPNCATLSTFGNARACGADHPSLAVCGASEKRVCAGGWLCFDSPEAAFCGCEKDADCQGRAAYINAARARRSVAPLGARCVAGRCAGAP